MKSKQGTENNSKNTHGEHDIGKLDAKRRQRRQIMKSMALTGAAGAPAIVAKQNSDWIKPVIETVITPAHATTTNEIETNPITHSLANSNVQIGEDTSNPCAHDLGGCGVGNHVVVNDPAWLWDDSSGITFTGVVNPPEAVEVSVQFNQELTTFTGFNGGSPQPVVADPTTGKAEFGKFEPTNSDFGDMPLIDSGVPGFIHATFSAPGANDVTVTLKISSDS